VALTAKQQMFVKEYLVDLNATQAAIRAGYSVKTAGQIGDEILKKPEIAAAVQAGMDARSQRTEITADYVLDTIRKTIERCQSAEEYQPAAVLKGAELLGKHLKLFTDKLEHSGGVTVNVNKP
jgi:phage terminase small subunit